MPNPHTITLQSSNAGHPKTPRKNRRERRAASRRRRKRKVPTETLKLSTTPQTLAALDELVATGLFGKTRTEAAEQLLRERLRELVNQERRKRR